MKLPISLVVITKNEAAHIARCLKSVPWADEIIVVDSGSQDSTVEIAKSLGAKCSQKEWMGFGPQKKWASSLASNDWVLSLDADEALSPELSEEITQRFSGLDPCTGYLLPRLSFHMGRWIKHGGWYPDYQLKLFNKKHSMWNEKPIHEKVIASQTGKFQKPVHHWVFKNLSHQVQTNDRYSTLQAEDHISSGKRFSLLKLIVKPWSKFMECYFLKLGVLDGLPGFVIAVGAAYSVFIRWGKIWEMEKLKEKK